MHRSRPIALACALALSALALIPSVSRAQDQPFRRPPPPRYTPFDLVATEDVAPWLVRSERTRLRTIGMEMTIGGFTAAAAGGLLIAMGSAFKKSLNGDTQLVGTFTTAFGFVITVAGGATGILGIPLWVANAKDP